MAGRCHKMLWVCLSVCLSLSLSVCVRFMKEKKNCWSMNCTSFVSDTLHVIDSVVVFKYSTMCEHTSRWPCGPMDKASDYGSGDSRLESWQGRPF